jgi:hypothetical protein
MYRIYARAEATVIAAAGNDPTFGLPGFKHRERELAESVMIEDQQYTFVPPDPAHEIKSSAWNSRAWTYQEAVLSQRRLVFCEQQIYFECPGMHCYEAMQSPLHLLHNPTLDGFSEWNEPGLFHVTTKQRYPLDQLFDHMAQYTERFLTNHDDILNGILGIFEKFHVRATSGELARKNQLIMHIAGIPLAPDSTILYKPNPLDPQVQASTREGQFLTGLWWNLKKPSKRRAGFPSWSWTVWYGTVLPRNEYRGYIRNTNDMRLSVAYLGHIRNLPRHMGLETALHHIQRGDLATGDIPTLEIEGDVIRVRLASYINVGRARSNFENRQNRIVAFINIDDEEVACEKFFLNHEECVVPDGLAEEEYPEEHADKQFSGLVLGWAQRTSYARNSRVRTLRDGAFDIVILVLWKQNGVWERLGLIQHQMFLSPIDNERTYFDRVHMKTTRQRLRLG